MTEIITKAEENKFSEFSDAVKSSLEDKFRNNPEVQNALSKERSLDKITNAFKTISNKRS